ncbi:hypothetical protein I305_03533 [Cryptococcus gattii E566]|uniref:Asl1-like glycosyl hydrolase catalytic domain-containing protein n=2 Tax=Cryptococcus gattii TaxID=37769 RepID=E6R597_CRYGW|nr:uncharacterized protein CGB_D0290W [Cryptococcus gattii WM276]ADV21461.1 conserved hypothetical protein [Cryptococcus gattii WM276]KIR81074.1 hypothetical protein I306_01787 [Cryptococcus gattii EJB2]KIY34178.1 hypothetical protein I305_03533 [Cryptococcus gattii E566]KJE03693.1 hypothetical protein I311_02456 [Cryptococcus gattii NT-10]
MQIGSLVPLLALLAAPAFARSSVHPNAAAHRRQDIAHERVNSAVERREALAQTQPRALAEKPKFKKINRRGARGCRAKNSTATASDSATASAPSGNSTVVASNSTDTNVTSAVTTQALVGNTSFSSEIAAATASSIENLAALQQPSSSSSTGDSSTAASSSSVASAAATSSAAATASSSSNSTGSYTPNGIKAGISGDDPLSFLQGHIGWYYDWNASPSGSASGASAANMLWGAGTVDSTDASRLAAFKALTSTPEYIIGFEEPDCSTPGSSNIAVADAASLWDSTIAPWKAKGSTLISPSMCHQAAEQYTQWLAGFSGQISTSWDITNLHINKNSMDGVKADIDYYYTTYGKPIWVTEFACVDDSTGFVPCTDQSEINTFINDIVDLFESDDRIQAYAYSTGEGLSSQWDMISNGALTESGQTYLSAISKYH